MTLLYAFIFYALCTIYFLHLHFMLFSPLLTWAFTFISFLFCSLEIFFSFWRYLITNLNNKSFKVTQTIWLLSLAFWSYELLGLRIKSFNLPWDLVTSTVILYEALGVYPKTLGCLFALCACCSDYMFCLWLGIHLLQPLLCPIFVNT